jgi:hypothetical protein
MLVHQSNSLDTLREIAAALPVRVDDPELTARIVADILNSATLEEATADRKMPSLGDRPDQAFSVSNLGRVDGGQNTELGFYLIMEVTYGKSEPIAVATGAANVVAVLLWAFAHGELDGQEWKLVEVASTKNPGRFVQRLVKADHF